MGLGRGDLRRPLDFRAGSKRVEPPPAAPLTLTVGTAGMRNSGFTDWHVNEILREHLAPGPLYRDRVLCLPPLCTVWVVLAVGTSGGVSLARHWSRMLRTSFNRSSASGLGGS